MNDKRFREDMRYLGMLIRNLKNETRNAPKPYKEIVDDFALLAEDKLSDVIKDVYAEQIKKGDWLQRNDEMPL